MKRRGIGDRTNPAFHVWVKSIKSVHSTGTWCNSIIPDALSARRMDGAAANQASSLRTGSVWRR